MRYNEIYDDVLLGKPVKYASLSAKFLIWEEDLGCFVDEEGDKYSPITVKFVQDDTWELYEELEKRDCTNCRHCLGCVHLDLYDPKHNHTIGMSNTYVCAEQRFLYGFLKTPRKDCIGWVLKP